MGTREGSTRIAVVAALAAEPAGSGAVNVSTGEILDP